MIERLKARLVDDARQCWRWSSVRFAVLAGAVASWATSDPKGFEQAIGLLPEWVRPLSGLALAACAIGLRVSKSSARKDP